MMEAPKYSRSLAVGLGYHRHIYRVMVYNLVRFLREIKEPFTLNRSDDVIYLHRKDQEILLGSALHPSTLEGTHEIVACWFDEAGYASRASWEVLQRRTGQLDAQMLITSIPYFEGWLKTDLYDLWLKNGGVDDDDITYIQCRTIDNPTYSRAEIERARARLPEYLFRSRYLGEWAKPFGLIYPEPDDDFLYITPEAAFPNGIPDQFPLYAGHDWGWTDPCTGLWAVHDPDRDILYACAEYEDSSLPVEAHVRSWQRDVIPVYGQPTIAWGDPTAPAEWNTAGNLGYPIENAENDFTYGVSCVTDRLRTGRLKFLVGLDRWRDYRARYLWAKDTKDDQKLLDKEAPRQAAAHMMDTTRYLCAGMASRGLSPDPPSFRLRTRTHSV